MAVKSSIPVIPRLEIVNVPPAKSSLVNLPSLAFCPKLFALAAIDVQYLGRFFRAGAMDSSSYFRELLFFFLVYASRMCRSSVIYRSAAPDFSNDLAPIQASAPTRGSVNGFGIASPLEDLRYFLMIGGQSLARGQ